MTNPPPASPDLPFRLRPGEPSTAGFPRRRQRVGTVRISVRSLSPTQAASLRAAVFLDRDGTLMHDPGYCSRPEQVRIIHGADTALRSLRDAGFLLIVITNQSGIGRGLISIEQFHAVTRELDRQIGEGILDRTYFCAALPGSGDPRRKPSPNMVFEAMRDFAINPRQSWFVGDKALDIECGRRAGTRTILVQTGHGQLETTASPDFIAPSIVEAATIILQHKAASPRNSTTAGT